MALSAQEARTALLSETKESDGEHAVMSCQVVGSHKFPPGSANWCPVATHSNRSAKHSKAVMNPYYFDLWYNV